MIENFKRKTNGMLKFLFQREVDINVVAPSERDAILKDIKAELNKASNTELLSYRCNLVEEISIIDGMIEERLREACHVIEVSKKVLS
jgi:hypothetical protein